MGITFDTTRAADFLLERDDALAALHDSLAGAHTGHGRALLVSGEAGVGKTSLVRSFCQGLDPRTAVYAGACDALSTPRPLGPLLDLDEDGSTFSALVRLGAPPSEVFATLQDLLAEQPTVLLIEDIHWADEATLDVLRLLVRRVETLPVLVVMTYRDDELDRAHPVRILLGDLATVAAVDRLHLDVLSADAVTQLASGHAIDPVELHRTTGGNPFFATEVLASGSTSIPMTVRDAVLGRAAALDRDAIRMLEAVALTPPRAEPWLLERVAIEAVGRLEDCLDSGLVTSDERGVAFRHELARIAIEDAMTPTRRRALHRRILATLADRPAGELDYARLAHHAEAAEDAAAVLAFAPEAAVRASAARAHREAAAQYARALRFGVDLPPGERATLLEGRSRACYLADDQVEAIAVIRNAIECRRTERARAQHARALVELSSYLSCRGYYTESREAVAEATQLVAGEPESPELGWVVGERARLSYGSRDAVGLARRAVGIAQRCGDEADAARALVTLGTAQLFFDFDEGRETLERVVAQGSANGRTEQVARAITALAQLGARFGRPDVSDLYLGIAVEHCEEHSSDLWRIHVLALCALSALEQGRWTEAAEFASRLLDDPRDSPWPHVQALLVLALVRARRGDPDARVPLNKALGLDIPPEEFGAVVDRSAAHAEVAWLERRLDEIDEATAASFDAAVARNDTPAICRLGYWRQLAGVAVDVPGDAVGPFALCLAGAGEDAAAEWTRLGRPYEAALALAETGMEESLRQAHDDLQKLGALPAARLASQRLRTLGVRDVSRGPRAATRENPAGLTARELDVLALLRDGLRNATIAERLVISPRTVDHHVSAILRKLDARTRGEAGAKAAELGLLEDR